MLGTPLETGNLTRHGLFVPTLLRMAESARQTQGRRLLLGRDQALTLALRRDSTSNRDAEIAWLIEQASTQTEGSNSKVVPEVRTTPDGTRLGWGSVLADPGVYEVRRDGQLVATFGLNHKPQESQLDPWLPDEWTQTAKSVGWPDIPVWSQPADQVGELVEQHTAGERLAWYFFLAALLALAFETLFLSRWNTLFS